MRNIMVKVVIRGLFVNFLFLGMYVNVSAQNPFITDRYTADPTARVFNDTLFVYPSSDTACSKEQSNNGFCMHNYHVYSTTDLTNWTDHGEILNHKNVPWVKYESYGMWAPDCIEKDGKYYFYFPGIPKDESAFRQIGVAISEKPTGPFIPEENYIQGVTGIDPGVFIDDDERIFLYYGGGDTLWGVELNDDMISIKGKPRPISDLPEKYKEGPFVFKRNGIYYFTFPHSPSGSEEIAYATGDGPLGPFTYKGKVMERWKDGCWTNHHSFVEYNNQWFIFYHHHDISGIQVRRSIRADRIYFNEHGEIPEIKATLRGIGHVNATDKVQIDRHSALQNAKVKKDSQEVVNWIISGLNEESIVEYHDLDFGDKEYSHIIAYVKPFSKGGTIEVFSNQKLISTLLLPRLSGEEWITVSGSVEIDLSGLQDITIKYSGKETRTELDWVQFISK